MQTYSYLPGASLERL